MAESVEHIENLKLTPIEHDFTIDWEAKLEPGVSRVRRCKQISTGTQFVVKILRERPRSRQEIRIHQQLSNHPHIVSLHSVYQNPIKMDDETKPKIRLLLVMELMPGGDLIEWLNKHVIDEVQVVRYMRQMVDTLKYVHGLGIAHCDIKPENFLLSDHTEDAIVKMADFGFAKEDNGQLKSRDLTETYVAPEVLKVALTSKDSKELKRELEDRKVPPQDKEELYILLEEIKSQDDKMLSYDKRCDLWSLGVTMFYMLCNQHPFPYYDGNLCENWINILKNEYNFSHKEWEIISDDAKNIVRRLLQVEPSERMTVEELADHPWLTNTYSATSSSTSPSSLNVVSDEDKVTEVPAQRMTMKRTHSMTNNNESSGSPNTPPDGDIEMKVKRRF